MSHPSADEPIRWPPLLRICALGVALRLLFLFLVGDLELQSDEANYVYLGIAWNHFGFYFDQHRYLWPPGYSWLMAHSLELFGERGMLAVKALQVLASASIGLTTMLFALRLFGPKAARLAGYIWVAYLPLIAFTHLLWNETLFTALFLPGLYQLMVVMQRGAGVAATGRLLVAGVCLAGSLYLKESPQFLVVVLALLLIPFAGGLLEGVRRASLLLLVLAACILPWGLRNLEVYGTFISLGTSLGENAYNGLNEDYRNFDLIPVDVERQRREQGITKPVGRHWFTNVDPIPFSELDVRLKELRGQVNEIVIANTAAKKSGEPLDPRAWVLGGRLQRNQALQARLAEADPPVPADTVVEFGGGDGWARAEPPEVINTAERSKVNMAKGLQFARDHPSWYLRSRLRKLADFLTPMSFFTRHLALGHYDETPIGGQAARKALSLWAVACPVLVLLLGIAGFTLVLRDRPAWLLFGCTLGYFLCTTLLVGMSRFRIPVVPLLIVLAAGLLSRRGEARSPWRMGVAALSVAFVLFLWWIILPETWLVFSDMVWRRYEG